MRSVFIVLSLVCCVLVFAPLATSQITYGTVDFAIFEDSTCQTPWNFTEAPQNGSYSYVDLSSFGCYSFQYNDTAGNNFTIGYKINCTSTPINGVQYYYSNYYFNDSTCSTIPFALSHVGPLAQCNHYNISYNGTNSFNGTTFPTLYSQLICTATGLPSSSSTAPSFNVSSSSPISSSSTSSTGNGGAITSSTGNDGANTVVNSVLLIAITLIIAVVGIVAL